MRSWKDKWHMGRAGAILDNFIEVPDIEAPQTQAHTLRFQVSLVDGSVELALARAIRKELERAVTDFNNNITAIYRPASDETILPEPFVVALVEKGKGWLVTVDAGYRVCFYLPERATRIVETLTAALHSVLLHTVEVMVNPQVPKVEVLT